jgi:hypothetical protein
VRLVQLTATVPDPSLRRVIRSSALVLVKFRPSWVEFKRVEPDPLATLPMTPVERVLFVHAPGRQSITTSGTIAAGREFHHGGLTCTRGGHSGSSVCGTSRAAGATGRACLAEVRTAGPARCDPPESLDHRFALFFLGIRPVSPEREPRRYTGTSRHALGPKRRRTDRIAFGGCSAPQVLVRSPPTATVIGTVEAIPAVVSATTRRAYRHPDHVQARGGTSYLGGHMGVRSGSSK